MEETKVASIAELISRTADSYQGGPDTFPWFRGEQNNPIDGPGRPSELLPKLYRITADGRKHYENRLLQNFRMKAPVLRGDLDIPPRQGHTDQWLFLAQHVGLPTRLLDWTESLMVALYFALEQGQPVIWMLDPISLNNLSDSVRREDYVFPLTWFQPKDGSVNIGEINIRGAWEADGPGIDRPVAVLPTFVHPRMSVQRSTFTVQGKDKRPLSHIIDEPIIQKFVLDTDNLSEIR